MKMTQFLPKLNKLASQSILKYNLIENNNYILVAVSGGKDSLTLIKWLNDRRKIIPISYKLGVVHFSHPSTPQEENKKFQEFLKNLNLEFIIWEPAPQHNINSENNDNCYICAKLRRQRLFNIAQEKNIKTIALGHHREDANETFLMNIFYSGKTSTMLPKQSFFNNKLTLIRPFYLVPEDLIIKQAKLLNLPIIKAACFNCQTSKRSEMKNLIEKLHRKNNKIKGNIASAIKNVRINYLPIEENNNTNSKNF